MDDVFWVTGLDGRTVHYVSRRFSELFGRSPDKILREPLAWVDSIHEDDRDRILAQLSEENFSRLNTEYRIRRPDGTCRWVWDRRFPVRDNQGRLIECAGVTVDITSRREQEEELRNLALTLDREANSDSLTRVLNRRGLERVLLEELHRHCEGGIAAVLIDLDNFKQINDTLGHSVGDSVLREIADKIRAFVRPSDLVGRVGGDEFLVMLPETSLQEACQVSERLRMAVGDCTLWASGKTVRVTASFGVAPVPENALALQEIQCLCDEALQESKRLGRNQVAMLRSVNSSENESTEAVGRESSVEAQELRAVMQPIVDAVTEKPIAFEFLTRGPVGSLEQPESFFHRASETNRLCSIDLACLRVCLDAARKLPEEYAIHLNIFPSTLLETPAGLLTDLIKTHLEPSRVCFELSEKEFIGAPRALQERILDLKKHGFRFAIDDVGFGRSCLESLISLQPDVIKLDRSLLMDLVPTEADLVDLHRILDISRRLAGTVIAEGVESLA